MSYLPIELNSEQLHFVVIGGGIIATRKIRLLVNSGASVTVVSPTATAYIAQQAMLKKLVWHQRPYEKKDVERSKYCIIATNQLELNNAIQEQCAGLVCRVDDAFLSDFILPATLRRGELLITVSTNANSPALTKKIVRSLEEQFDEKYTSYIQFLGQCRQTYRHNKVLLQQIVDERFLNYSLDERQQELEKLVRLQE